MKQIRYFTAMMLFTFIFWHLIVSFIYWNIVWVENLPYLEARERILVFLAVLMKICFDALLWLGLKEILKKEGKL